MAEKMNVVGAAKWRLRGIRYRLEAQNRPIPLDVTETAQRKALRCVQEIGRKERILYTAEMLLDQYGDEEMAFKFRRDLQKLIDS